MDKFEFESFTKFRTTVEELQECFIDGDAYSRTPTFEEWRRASRLVRLLSLMCHELYGYANACRQYNIASIKERLHITSNKGGEQEKEEKNSDVGTSEELTKQGFVEFTDKEIKQMPTHFRRLIIVNKKRCRMRKHVSGKNSTTYEIRFRQDGYNISACGKTIELAKANMLQKLKTAKPKKGFTEEIYIPSTFHSFALYYFENFRIEQVTSQTYEKDLNRYNNHLKPFFNEKELRLITPTDCKIILKTVKDAGKGKTADELRTLMNAIFNAAIKHRLLEFNPLSTVLHIQHDRKEGQALTQNDEQKLLAWLPTCDCAVELALMLFCGLRANEVENPKFPPIEENGFIKAVNSKRHFRDKSKIEFKFIPICDRLRSFLKNGIDIRHTAKTARRRLKEILPSYTLKDLRTTFFTKCQIYGVAESALKEFMGHSFGKLGNAYSDLTKHKDYLLKEGKKLNEW